MGTNVALPALCGLLCLALSISAAAPAQIAVKGPRIGARGRGHHRPVPVSLAEAALSPQGKAVGAVVAAGCIAKSAGGALGLVRTLMFWGRALPVLLVSIETNT